jgi:methylmalonyl-CoA/ethylmalonyl-CoA epimerase
VRREVERPRGLRFDVVSEPHVIFSHTNNDLGHLGVDEWMAFAPDSEGNLVGLMSHHKGAAEA